MREAEQSFKTYILPRRPRLFTSDIIPNKYTGQFTKSTQTHFFFYLFNNEFIYNLIFGILEYDVQRLNFKIVEIDCTTYLKCSLCGDTINFCI